MKMIKWSAIVAVAAAVVPITVHGQATTSSSVVANGTIYACYAPSTGTVYRIKGPGLPDDCQGPKAGNNQHVGFSWNATGIQGAQGPQGVAGAQGPKGDKGDAGVAGAKGEKGDAGLAGVAGAAGATGSAGPQGERGERGDIGPAGATGPVGPRGVEGPKGDRGTNGSTGPQGPAGPAGVNGFSGYEIVTTFVGLPPRGAFSFDVRTYDVYCPGGKVFVGGGALNSSGGSPSEIPPTLVGSWPTILGGRHALTVQLYNPSIIAGYTYRLSIACANAN